IFYSIENLVNSGIDQIGIIISEKDSLLKQVVGDGSRWGVEIEYIIQKEMTGLGSAIMTARDYINNEPFILYLGDNVINYNIADLVNRYFEEKLNALLLLAKVDCPQRFGVPEIRDGKIVSVEERPMHPKSEFAVTGVYIYDENAFKAMDSIEISDRGQYEISDIHNYYINSNLKLDYQEIDKWWKDRGKPEDLLEGNKFVLQNCVFEKRQEFMEGEIVGNAKVEGNVKIGKGTRIIGKTLIRGPVSIGEGCLIKDSYVGPYTSIGNVSELNGTEIEHSLVMDNVNIYTKEKIVNSVIGRNASIVSGEDNLPRGKKVIIGENSVVGW
ncbi:MAG: glucose-1-phosphate thymidylyltransferase, partial [Candidatus Pacebacteria bacterium]|nr:glucose-1-phosphate thymidylyltransferase [Candidatus Paceibacterota bacterium]